MIPYQCCHKTEKKLTCYINGRTLVSNFLNNSCFKCYSPGKYCFPWAFLLPAALMSNMVSLYLPFLLFKLTFNSEY